MEAFPFSVSLFYITGKIDQAFATLLQPSEDLATSTPSSHQVSMTEQVRIRSLVEETRIVAVNIASAGGYLNGIRDISELETEDEEEEESDDDGDDDEPSQVMSISLGISKIYKRTLEILGDALVSSTPPQEQDIDI